MLLQFLWNTVTYELPSGCHQVNVLVTFYHKAIMVPLPFNSVRNSVGNLK